MYYSKLEKYVKKDGHYMSFYVTRDIEEINSILLDNLYWHYVINAGYVSKIIHKNSSQLVIYHDNGFKLVFTK